MDPVPHPFSLLVQDPHSFFLLDPDPHLECITFLSNPFSSFFLIEFSFLSVKWEQNPNFSGQLQPIFPKVIFLFKSPRSLVKLDPDPTQLKKQPD